MLIDEAELMAQLQAMAEQAGQGQGAGAEALRDANPMMALLRSLLPWAADGQQPDYAADDDDGPQQQQREIGQLDAGGKGKGDQSQQCRPRTACTPGLQGQHHPRQHINPGKTVIHR